MFQICDFDKCCGCGACENICPKQCIELQENEHGVKIPFINESMCINCGLCKQVCSQNSTVELREPTACYAARSKDDAQRLDSASGGVGYMLYKEFLQRSDAPVVCGVKFNESSVAIFKTTKELDEVEKFRGSKYVQAEIGELYTDIANALKTGHSVLLIALPCQVAGCLNFLKVKKIDNQRLYTVDLLCHGVSPQRYLTEQLEDMKNKHDWKSINLLTFRSNRRFRNFHFYVQATTKKGKKDAVCRYFAGDPYFYGFLRGVSLRESCYQCSFATRKRVADLTIGDFIGLGKMPSSPPLEENIANPSLILCNTKKGEELLKLIGKNIYLYDRPIEEAVEGASSLQKPFGRSNLRNEFLKLYPINGFIKTMDILTGNLLKKNEIKFGVKAIVKKAVYKLHMEKLVFILTNRSTR